MTRFTKVGVVALIGAAATIWLLPSVSAGNLDLERTENELREATQRLGGAVQDAVAPASNGLRATRDKTKSGLTASKTKVSEAASTRATATDPPRQPPLHGTNPHGQGGVAVVDTNPSAERPLGGNPDGSDSGEEVVVGRARGEQTAGGAYHGHITILALFGNELGGVDTTPGETKNGPLQPLQQGVLDPLCTSSGGQTCLSVLTANSQTTASGSTNDFALARANVAGLGVGAAESAGAISETADCQSSAGGARTANVTASGGVVAAAANSAATSQSCRNQAPQTTRTSQVIQLGGTGVALPAAGCADGTPDTVVEIPLVATIVCNADDVAGAAVVREALDVFVLNVAGNSLAKETTAASEAVSVAPSGPEGAAPSAPPVVTPTPTPTTPTPATPDDDERDDPATAGAGGGGAGPGAGAGAGDSRLPFTGTNVVGLILAGLLVLAGGLVLRRREDRLAHA